MTIRMTGNYHQDMEKETSKIQVVDRESRQILFECAVSESEKAYQYASDMELMGLDVEVLHPTLSDTLSTSLGLTPAQKQEYRDSVEEETEMHEGSCCFEDSDKETRH